MNSIDRLDRLRRFERLRRRMLVDRSNPIEELTDTQFERRFRFSKNTVMYILSEVQSHGCIGVNVFAGKNCYTPVINLLIALRFYATGSFQMTLGDTLEIPQQSCSDIVQRMSRALASMRTIYIRFPSHEEASEVRRHFYDVAGLPGIISAIDCTHIKLDCPRGIPSDQIELYRNRKGEYSINVQVCCKANLEITSIVAKWYGSAHDARIFDNSLLKARLESGVVPGNLIGDSGYPCLQYLLTPVLRTTSVPEARYNAAHVKTRNCVERVFGIIKRMFPCLRRGLRNHIRRVPNIIISCAVLYNISRRLRDSIAHELPSDSEQHDCDESSTDGSEISSSSSSGIATRNTIIRQYFAS